MKLDQLSETLGRLKLPAFLTGGAIRRSHFIISSLCLLALAFFAVGLAVIKKPEEQYAHSLANWQDADSAPGYPMVVPDSENEQGEKRYWSAKFSPNLAHLPALTRFRLPTAPFLSSPVGTANGAFCYDAQAFFAENKERGGHHLGSDLNGIGGQHTDLGDPVHAIGNGLVLYTGEPSPGWGKTVIIAHRLPDGRLIHSMSAHLHEIKTYVGEVVPRGKIIGSIGTANGRYLAHLHFEIRESDGLDYHIEEFPSCTLNGGYSDRKFNRLDPSELLTRYAPEKDESHLAPSAFGLLLKKQNDPSKLQFDSASAEKLGDLMSPASNK